MLDTHHHFKVDQQYHDHPCFIAKVSSIIHEIVHLKVTINDAKMAAVENISAAFKIKEMKSRKKDKIIPI